LLKMLEEPPEKAIFFLTTSIPSRLLPTIVSRCQKMRFDPLTEADIAEVLNDRWQFDRNQAEFFAGLSGGSLQHALELSAEGFPEKRDAVLNFLEASFEGDPEVRYASIEILTVGREKVEILFLFQILIVLLRDLLCLQIVDRKKVLNMDSIEQLERFVQKWPTLNPGEGMLHVQHAIDMIQKNVYLPLALYELSRQLHASASPASG